MIKMTEPNTVESALLFKIIPILLVGTDYRFYGIKHV